MSRAAVDVRTPSALHRGHILSVADSPTVQAFLQPHKCRIADLRLITHRSWLALYPPDEFVSGIKGAFDVEMGALPIPSIPLI